MWGHGKAGCLGSHRPVAESPGGHLAPISRGGRGLCGAACGWLGAETRGSLCVWDDSGPMITACAYLGSVNKWEREAEEVKKGKIVAGQRGVVGWEGRVPSPHS